MPILPENSIKSTSPFHTSTIFNSALHIKMGFLRKYFIAVFGEFLLLSVVCSIIMLTPVAHFYIAENDWIMYLLCFMYFASFVSLLYFAKLPVINRILFTHVIIQAFAVGVFVTSKDLMYIYKAILMSSCSILMLFIYTLQSKWNFSLWIAIIIDALCVYVTSSCLTAAFGGSTGEINLSLSFAAVILFYHLYAIFVIMDSLTPGDYLYALINVHTMPINVVVFSSSIFKLSK